MHDAGPFDRLSGDPHPLCRDAVRRRDGGLGGAYLSLAYTPMWAENMTAGRGWIALALVVFAAWRPGWLLVGAYLFGGIMYGSLAIQAAGAISLFGQPIGGALAAGVGAALPRDHRRAGGDLARTRSRSG